MDNLSCIPKFVKKEQTDIWVGETLKLMLLNSTHIPNAATQRYIIDLTEFTEISDVGGKYLAGGVLITGKVSKADPNSLNNYFLDADDVVIGPGATLNYRFGILYKVVDVNNHAVNLIRAQIDFLTDQIVTNGVSTIKWNTLGLIYIS